MPPFMPRAFPTIDPGPSGGADLDASYMRRNDDSRKSWGDFQAAQQEIDVRGVAGPKAKPAGSIAKEPGNTQAVPDMLKGAVRSAIELAAFPGRAALELGAAAAGDAAGAGVAVEGFGGEDVTPESQAAGKDLQKKMQSHIDEMFEGAKQGLTGDPTEGSQAWEEVLGVPFIPFTWAAQTAEKYVKEHTGSDTLAKAAGLAAMMGVGKVIHGTVKEGSKLTRDVIDNGLRQGMETYLTGRDASSAPVTGDAIRAAVPSAKTFTPTADGIVAEMPNGSKLTFKVTGEIEADVSNMPLDQAAEVQAGGKISGKAEVLDKEGVISLVDGVADAGTINHEVLHTARKLALDAEENAVLDTKFKGDEEAMARAYAKDATTNAHSWAAKVYQFAKGLVDPATGVFRGVQSGEAWKGQGAGGEGTNLEIKVPDTPEFTRPFTSKIEDVVNQKMGGKMPMSQLKKMLEGAGVTKDEITKTFSRYLGDGIVTKERVLEDIAVSKIQTKDVILGEEAKTEADLPTGYSVKKFREGNYTVVGPYGEMTPLLPTPEAAMGHYFDINGGRTKDSTKVKKWSEKGGSPGTYKEMFVTVERPPLKNFTVRNDGMVDVKDNDFNVLETVTHSKAMELSRYQEATNHWKDGHDFYDEIDNPIVRIRFDERPSADGKRVMFVEEIQGPSEENQAKMPEALRKRIYDIGVKRVLAYAKEQGFDAVAWTPGKMQADRYSLEKQVSRIDYTKNDDGTVAVSAWGKEEPRPGNGDRPAISKNVQPKDLPSIVGKELSEKILSSSGKEGTLSGVDLKVGGEGLKDLYDRVIPNLFKKYGKEVDGSESGPEIPYGKTVRKYVYDGPDYTVDQLTGVLEELTAKRKKALDEYNSGPAKVHGVSVSTPDMDRAINEINEISLHMDRGGSFRDGADNFSEATLHALKAKSKGVDVPERTVKTPSVPITDKTPASYPLYEVKNKPVDNAPKVPLRPGPSDTKTANTGPSYKHIETEEGAKATLQGLIGETWTRIQDERRGSVARDVTTKAAQDLIESTAFTPADILNRNTGENWKTPAHAAAARMVWTENMNRFHEALAKNDAGMLSDAELENQTAFTMLLTEKVYGGTAEAGRTLDVYNADVPGVASKGYMEAAYGILAGMNRSGMNIKDISRRFKGLGTPERQAKLVSDLNRPGAWDMFTELWYGSLLSNPATHSANALSNAIVLFNGVQERAQAEQYRSLNSAVRRAFGGNEVPGVAMGESWAMLHALVEGAAEAMIASSRTLKTGVGTFGEGKVEGNIQPALTVENLKAMGNRIAGSVKEGAKPFDPDTIGPIGKAFDFLWEAFPRGPGKALLAGDEFFKSINYRMEIAALSWRNALVGEGQGATLADRYQYLKDNPSGRMVEAAQQYARYQTFTDQGGKVTAGIMSVRESHPVGRLILPFVKTPSRVAHYTFERMPVLNAFSGELRRDLFGADPVKRDLAMAKVGTSAMALAAAATLVSTGAITGGGPRDRKMRADLMATGWMPYSVKVGDTYVTYDRLDPIGAMFGAVADYVEIRGSMNMGEGDEDSDVIGIPLALTLGMTRAFTSKTYLTGFSEALDAITNPGEKGPGVVRKFTGSFIPAGINSVNRNWFDPYNREVYEVIDEWKKRTPGYSDTLPPKRDPWGQPSINHGWALGVLIPTKVSKAVDDPALDEMRKVKISVPPMPQIIPGTGAAPPDSTMGKLFGMKSQGQYGVKWTPKEYDDISRLYGNMLKLDWSKGGQVDHENGVGMHDYLNALVKGTADLPAPVPLPDGGQAAKYTDLPAAGDGSGGEMRADILRQIMRTYRAAAQDFYLNETGRKKEQVRAQAGKAIRKGAPVDAVNSAADKVLDALSR